MLYQIHFQEKRTTSTFNRLVIGKGRPVIKYELHVQCKCMECCKALNLLHYNANSCVVRAGYVINRALVSIENDDCVYF